MSSSALKYFLFPPLQPPVIFLPTLGLTGLFCAPLTSAILLFQSFRDQLIHYINYAMCYYLEIHPHIPLSNMTSEIMAAFLPLLGPGEILCVWTV